MAKKRIRMTLRYLNTKYANPLGLNLHKGSGYFYVKTIDPLCYIDNEEEGILVYRMNDLSEAQWKSELEYKASCITDPRKEKPVRANNMGMGGPYG